MIHDISQPLGTRTAVWPGDRPFGLDWSLRRTRGDSVDVATVTLSVHTGTHVDGPAHVVGGPAVGSLDLAPFYGPAVVVDARPAVTGTPARVGPEALDGLDPARTPRVLLRTRDDVDPGSFPSSFAALSVDLARRVVAEGYVLVGTDAPSVDPVDSTPLEAHRILVAGGVPNVENLVLTDVAAGFYTFIGLPLRLTEADSSPIRAALVSGPAPGA
ncbi:MAG: cyclase family protein [Gemmatimonadota bacterium]